MRIDTQNLVSMTEANQNFSKVAHLVDQNGAAVILKNNKPRYLVIAYEKLQTTKIEDDATVDEIAGRVMKHYRKAFEELAK